MQKKNRNLIKEYEAEVDGQKVTVHRFKPKDKKVVNNARSNFTSCPNCLSHITLDEAGLQKCTGDRIVIWEKEFLKYRELSTQEQQVYMKNISYDSTFMELYDRWAYSQNNPDEPFTCGFTNKIFFPIPSCSVIIPDPAQVNNIEKRLGRKLTENELIGESELFEYQGSVFEKYKKGSKRIRIIMIRFPEDV